MPARRPLQVAANDRIYEALRERQVAGDGIGTTARWVIEQYLAIVEAAGLDDIDAETLREMILFDDRTRTEDAGERHG